MHAVTLALLPGLLVQCLWFGGGALLQVLVAMLAAWSCARLLTGRYRALLQPDPPALVTGALIGLALPPLAPWWVAVIAALAAIGVAREAYGGLGANLFNPAMVGYAIVLVAFPGELARWPGDGHVAGLGATLSSWLGQLPADGLTGATTLEAFRFREGLTSAELFAADARFGSVGGAGWEWINAAFAAGGIWLIRRRVIGWHAPAGLLAGIALPALLLADAGSSSGHGGVLLHWFTGGTMLAAFFIATDPVTSPARAADRFWLAAAVGVVVYVIRAFGHYADGIAFAVLLGNSVAPLIDTVRNRLPPADRRSA